MTRTAGFSDDDFETLDKWLLRRGTGVTDIVELEGFLTAIVIAPNTLSPALWLPKVRGGKQPIPFLSFGQSLPADTLRIYLVYT